MNSKQLKYFLTTVEEGSIASAARILNIAQPAVSLQISNLEHELKVNLFVRDFTGVKLTEAGELFFKHANRIIKLMFTAQQEITELTNDVSGNITIGMCQAICNVLAQPLLEEVQKTAPKVNINILTGPPNTIKEWLSNEQIDIGLSYQEDIKEKDFENISLLKEAMFVVMAKKASNEQHQSLLAKTHITFTELENIPLIKSNCGRAFTKLIEAYQNKIGFSLNYSIPYPGQLLTALRLVTQGNGMMILPSSAFYHLELEGKVHAVKLEDPNIYREVVITHSATKDPKNTTKFLINTIKEQTQLLQKQNLWRV